MKRAYGWKKQKHDARDRRTKIARPRTGPNARPPVVDLRNRCPEVWDQGQLGACTAHAALAVFCLAEGLSDMSTSFRGARLALYYDERALEGTVANDAGAELRDGFKVLAAGVGPEPLWPYDITQYAVAPPQAYRDACTANRALQYEAVDQTADAIESVLAAGQGVGFGFTVYATFESDDVAQSGDVPMPLPGETVEGGHAVCLVGYDQQKRLFLVRNSWSDQWGIQGYFLMPYDYVLDPNLASDFWTVSRVVDEDPTLVTGSARA